MSGTVQQLQRALTAHVGAEADSAMFAQGLCREDVSLEVEAVRMSIDHGVPRYEVMLREREDIKIVECDVCGAEPEVEQDEAGIPMLVAGEPMNSGYLIGDDPFDSLAAMVAVLPYLFGNVPLFYTEIDVDYPSHQSRRDLNIEICFRQWGKGDPGSLSDIELESLAEVALMDARNEARAENKRIDALRRAFDLEICERHWPLGFIGWADYSDAYLAHYASLALDEAWDMAHREDASRERGKRIDACVEYYTQRDRAHFEAMDDATLAQWHSAVSRFRR
ncbi:hypothetical protein BN2476_830030 [Paraburkholderia piptadeniae]|uniref:Uncharacterized protein n=1 Tax=Paraburkholderia piptadeniae TaxID=1701573 RepID=A0A1N7SSL7_9BURK|nr:hypothetical protein [Paraburkholderia piptadeniae]SIT50459.1 hypothetical protein BN2476_830030 [Paraburkholderia piptadeniae]